MKRLITKPITVERVVEKVIEEKTSIVEEEGGLVALLGKRVILLCMNFFYVGKLVGVNSTSVELEDAGIVYETGEWNLKNWKDIQALPMKITGVMTSTIESFGEVSK